MRRWRPVMRRPVMPTNIMSSPETWNIQPHVTTKVRVKVTIPTLRKPSGHSSVNVTRTFAEKPCMFDSPRSVTLIPVLHPDLATGKNSLYRRHKTITRRYDRRATGRRRAGTVDATENDSRIRGIYLICRTNIFLRKSVSQSVSHRSPCLLC